jgi:hypothetical protein
MRSPGDVTAVKDLALDFVDLIKGILIKMLFMCRMEAHYRTILAGVSTSSNVVGRGKALIE